MYITYVYIYITHTHIYTYTSQEGYCIHWPSSHGSKHFLTFPRLDYSRTSFSFTFINDIEFPLTLGNPRGWACWAGYQVMDQPQ